MPSKVRTLRLLRMASSIFISAVPPSKASNPLRDFAAETAIQNSGKFLPWQVVTISRDGTILD